MQSGRVRFTTQGVASTRVRQRGGLRSIRPPAASVRMASRPRRARREIAPSESAHLRTSNTSCRLGSTAGIRERHRQKNMLAIADRLFGSRTGSQLARRGFHLAIEQSPPLTRTHSAVAPALERPATRKAYVSGVSACEFSASLTPRFLCKSVNVRNSDDSLKGRASREFRSRA
jgi:hypothetical protein